MSCCGKQMRGIVWDVGLIRVCVTSCIGRDLEKQISRARFIDYPFTDARIESTSLGYSRSILSFSDRQKCSIFEH